MENKGLGLRALFFLPNYIKQAHTRQQAQLVLHNRYFKKKGTTYMEIWKPLKKFPSYNVSSDGRIMNVKTQRILKTFINEKGYQTVCLRKNNKQYTVRVHKLIAETFLGEHPGMDIRHKDRNRSNNHVNNLEWCTRKETINSAFKKRN